MCLFSPAVSPIGCVAYSPDGRSILTASDDSQIRLMDASSGAVVRSFDGYAGALTFSPDSARIVASMGDAVRTWEVESGDLLWTAPVSDTENGAAFSPDGKTVLITTFSKKAYLLDAATGQEIRQFAGHSEGVFLLRDFTSTERVIYSISGQNPTCPNLEPST